MGCCCGALFACAGSGCWLCFRCGELPPKQLASSCCLRPCLLTEDWQSQLQHAHQHNMHTSTGMQARLQDYCSLGGGVGRHVCNPAWIQLMFASSFGSLHRLCTNINRQTGWRVRWHTGKPCMVGRGSMQLQPCTEHFICSKWPKGCAIASLICSKCWRPSICLCLLCVVIAALCFAAGGDILSAHFVCRQGPDVCAGVGGATREDQRHSSNLRHGEADAA